MDQKKLDTGMEEKGADMSFLDHLEALRWHLIRSVSAIILIAIVLFTYNDFIFGELIFGPKKADFITYRFFCKFSYWLGLGDSLCIGEIPFELINTNLSGQFTSHMWVSFVGGLILAFPYFLWEMWRFIKPALYEKESTGAKGFVAVSSLLFLTGVLFSYFLIVPLTINFLGRYQVSADVTNMIAMNSYISTMVTLTLIMGLVFELPVLIYFLTKFGIITPQFMRKYRRHSLVVILILSAVITPQDVTSMVLVAIPLYLLFEISILVSNRTFKKLADTN